MAGSLAPEALPRRVAGAGGCRPVEPDLLPAARRDAILNCDSIARVYRWLEYLSFGRELERRRFRYLPEVKKARRALVLGDGDGRFLAALVRQGGAVSVDYVDLSARMLKLARERAGRERVAYYHADALTLPLPSHEYDLIVSHFFFDCFEEREARLLVERVACAAGPDARWLVSEFREPRWARLFVRGLYLFFRVTTGLKTRRLIDHRPFLSEKGFRLVNEETSRFGLLASELWWSELPACHDGCQAGVRTSP